MKKNILILLMLTLMVISTDQLYASDVNIFDFGGDTPVEIEADDIEYLLDKNIYKIKGNAKFTSEGNILTADHITLDAKNNKVYAKDNVTVTTDGETITADSFDMDLKTKQGMIIKGRLFIKSENFYITGDSLERTGENTYIVKNGTFTTCDGKTPSWKFSASSLDIEIDGYVFAMHPVFYVKNVPAFYLPVVIFPIKETRQSGLLIPTVGYSSDDGTIIKQPYYQVISDSMDATVTLDSRSKMGTGADTQFRYVLSEQSSGEMNWYIMDELKNDESRWSFSSQHTEYFSQTLYLQSDISTVSDSHYFRDFGDDADERNKEYIESNVTLTQDFVNASIQVEHSHNRDLIYNEALLDMSDSYRQFPKVTGMLYKTPIGNTPLNYSGELIFNNYYKESYEDFSYVKFDPTLSAEVVLGPYATFTTFYTPELAKFWMHEAVDKDEHDDYSSYSTGAVLSSKLFRVFAPGDLTKVRHLINPSIEYEYIPNMSDMDYEPFYEIAGIKREKNEVTLRLINRFNVRREKKDSSYTYTEPVRLELAQPYDIYESKRELDPLIIDDKQKPYKPLYVDLDIRATRHFSLNGEMWHDHYMKDHVRQYNVSMEIKSDRKDKFVVKHTYLKDFDNYLKTYAQINMNGGLFINNTVRYDYLTQHTLEKTFGLDLIMQCWSMSVKYTEERIEDTTDPLNIDSYIDKTVFVYFSLRGVGETKDISIGAE